MGPPRRLMGYTAPMSQAQPFFKQLPGDRIYWMGVLIVLCFVSVFLFRSQSAASYPTYFLAIFMLFTAKQWADVFQTQFVRWIAALTLWLCASAFWSDPFVWQDALSVWIRGVLVFLFVVAVAECQLRGQMQRWMSKGVALVGAAAMAVALVNFLVTDPADGRLNGMGQLDTHVIAALVYGVVLLFALRLALGEKGVMWRWCALAAVVLAVVCIALSDSRTAWVSVALGVVTYILAAKSNDARQLLLAITAIGVIGGVVLLVFVVNDATREVILPRGDSFRLAIWSEILQRYFDAPFVGLGITTSDDVVVGSVTMDHAHNLYLSLLHQGGAVALVLYLVTVGYAFRAAIVHFVHEDAKIAIALLVLASSAFALDGHELIDKVGEAWFLVWLPIGICLGLNWAHLIQPEIEEA